MEIQNEIILELKNRMEVTQQCRFNYSERLRNIGTSLQVTIISYSLIATFISIVTLTNLIKEDKITTILNSISLFLAVATAAQKAQERISLIYESSIDAMWLIDIEDEGKTYRFKSINDAFIAVTGLTRAAVLEKTIEEVLPPSSIPLVRAKYSEAATTGHVVDYLEIAPLPSGLKVGQIRVKPIKDEQG